jgi:dipeptidyl aminopeptidase/acylaminoacyl peptidase
MTVHNDLDRRLTTYFEARVTSVRPGLLDDAMGSIETTGQQPGWTVAEWWLGPRAATSVRATTRAVGSFAAVAFVVLIVIAVLVIVGSQRRLPPPFGLAKPGLIALVSDGHVFTMNADGSNRTQQTFGDERAYRPTWSLDGTKIAYLASDGPCTINSCLNKKGFLVVITPDGDRRVTIADGLDAQSVGEIAWSPDSRRVAYAAVAASAPLSLSHVYIAEADGSGVRQLGDAELAGFEPAWSPDGTRIAFTRFAPQPGLWLIRADGSDAHPVAETSREPAALRAGEGTSWEFWDAQWSPDGSQLVFLGGDGGHGVWTVNADGTGERQLVARNNDSWWPAWSPDGSRIAFVEMVGAMQSGRFVIVNRDGSGAVVLDGPSVDGNMPVWSPDGTKLFGFLAENASCTPCQYSLHDPNHIGVVVYDVAGKLPPTVLPGTDEGTWQRLAP